MYWRYRKSQKRNVYQKVRRSQNLNILKSSILGRKNMSLPIIIFYQIHQKTYICQADIYIVLYTSLCQLALTIVLMSRREAKRKPEFEIQLYDDKSRKIQFYGKTISSMKRNHVREHPSKITSIATLNHRQLLPILSANELVSMSICIYLLLPGMLCVLNEMLFPIPADDQCEPDVLLP